MKLNMFCVGADASADGSFIKKYVKAFGNLGIKITSGVIIEFELTMFRRIFVISNPLEINRMNSGFRATMISMTDFEVSDPPKNIVNADLNGNLADVKIANRNSQMADVRITICDKMNQPNYTIQKFNVPYNGIMTSEFEVRGNLVLTQTFHRIQRDRKGAVSLYN
jgi:hypothetical protein